MSKVVDPYYKTKAWQHLRAAVLRRDLYTLRGARLWSAAYAVGHIKARPAGGADAMWNLRSLCKAHDHAVKEGKTGERGNAGVL